VASQFNTLPNYPVQLAEKGYTSKDWYFFWAGLFKGLAPGNVEPVVVGPSPFIYTALKRGSMIVNGGTVSLIEFSRDGVTFFDVGATAGMFALNASDQLRVTYTVPPTMTFVPS
jgi:hypothetical protein